MYFVTESSFDHNNATTSTSPNRHTFCAIKDLLRCCDPPLPYLCSVLPATRNNLLRLLVFVLFHQNLIRHCKPQRAWARALWLIMAPGCGCPSCSVGHPDSCSCASCSVGHSAGCGCVSCRTKPHAAGCACTECAARTHGVGCGCRSCKVALHTPACGCAACS